MDHNIIVPNSDEIIDTLHSLWVLNSLYKSSWKQQFKQKVLFIALEVIKVFMMCEMLI